MFSGITLSVRGNDMATATNARNYRDFPGLGDLWGSPSDDDRGPATPYTCQCGWEGHELDTHYGDDDEPTGLECCPKCERTGLKVDPDYREPREPSYELRGGL